MRWGRALAALVLAVIVWSIASGLVGRIVLSVRILDDLRRPRADSWLRRATPAPVVTSTVLEADGRRLSADLYRSPSSPFASPLIFVPGAVEQGKGDPRVAPFASLLARAGFTVVVPDLPSFRALRVHPDNLAEMSAAFDAVASRPDLAPAGRCGMFAVSYAGGIALLAALDEHRAARVPFLVVAGGYADLEHAIEFLATGRTTYRGRPHTARADPYGQLVFLRTYEDFLTNERDRELLERMASRRIADLSAPLADLADQLSPQGRLVYDLFETASPEQVPALLARIPDGLKRRMAELSPARHDFSTLRARLYLVHALDDGTFPAEEALILAEKARPHTRVRVLVLETLHHVDPEPWRKDVKGFLTRDVPEAVKLGAWWCDLLGERVKKPRAADSAP